MVKGSILLSEYYNYPLLNGIIGASVSESHLGSSTRPLSVCLYIYIYNWGERE